MIAGGILITSAGGMIPLVGGCGGDPAPEEAPDSGAGDAAPTIEVETLHPDAEPLPGEAECTVVITTNIPVTTAAHLPLCTEIKYASNPPCGGDHWPVWAGFEKFTTPVPRGAYVHSLEHGAVVLLHRCSEPCPEVVGMLEEVFDGVPADARCASQPSPPNARVLLTPDPEIPTPIAAAAWGATYTATCIHKPSLGAFVAKVYGKGPEDTCSPGHITGSDAGAAVCSPDGGAGGDGG